MSDNGGRLLCVRHRDCHTQLMIRPFTSSLAAVMVLLTLSACAGGPQYSDLARKATADDAWPSSLPDHAATDLDPESSRLVGRDGKTALYLAAATEPAGGACILVYPNDQEWFVSCGLNEMVMSGKSGTKYVLRSDGFATDDLRAISENVYVGRP